MIETVSFESKTLAIIIRREFSRDGIEFFTTNDFSQQLAYMHRPDNYVIQPHVHNPVRREVQYTKEVLFIKSGVVRIDFYSDRQEYIESTTLHEGDVILLAYGGHGFQIIKAAEIIEVKQGPYAGEGDKTRFQPVSLDKIKMRGQS